MKYMYVCMLLEKWEENLKPDHIHLQNGIRDEGRVVGMDKLNKEEEMS